MILRGARLQRVLRVSLIGILGLILISACVQKLGGEGSLRNRRARVVLRKPLALTIKSELAGTFFNKPIAGPHSVRSDLAGNIYFIDEGAQRVIKLNKEFEKSIHQLTKRNGWFVPASKLFDFLLKNQINQHPVSSSYLAKLDALWLFDRIIKKIRFGR